MVVFGRSSVCVCEVEISPVEKSQGGRSYPIRSESEQLNSCSVCSPKLELHA